MRSASVIRLSLFAAAVAAPAPCLGQEQKGAAEETYEICRAKPPRYEVPALCQDHPRLGAHEPSYAIYQRTEGDDDAARLHYSFRYTLFAPDCFSKYRALHESPEKFANKTEAERDAIDRQLRDCTAGYASRHEFYLMYTGEFDFYMITRESGPVVNRISNPGFRYRGHLRARHGADSKPAFWPRWWDIGVEHKSNGQSTDAQARVTDPTSPDFGRYRAQVEYEKNNRAYIDSISQDTNFVSLALFFQSEDQGIDFLARAKLFYFANDTQVTWGPLAGEEVKMSDYDRLRFVASYNFGSKGRRRAEQDRVILDWTLGDKWLKTDSFNLSVYLPLFNIPFYARAHYGPLHTLSDFTTPQKSIGIGVLLLE